MPVSLSHKGRCWISDADTAVQQTLKLLATKSDYRVLRVSKHSERPIYKLVFCHRRCSSNPASQMKDLVQALGTQGGYTRSYSGEACHRGEYIGNNIWGRGLDSASTYCPSCGYAMDGPQIHHVQIVKSNDNEWNQQMIDQCEIGAYWHEGKNLGISYELLVTANGKRGVSDAFMPRMSHARHRHD